MEVRDQEIYRCCQQLDLDVSGEQPRSFLRSQSPGTAIQMRTRKGVEKDVRNFRISQMKMSR